MYNAAAKAGGVLFDKATLTSDKTEIENILKQLKENWLDLKKKSQQRYIFSFFRYE